jgi:hypothetical protein
VDARRPGRRLPRHPRGRRGTEPAGGVGGLVPGPGVLQRAARGAGRDAPGAGTHRSARLRLRRPRRLPAGGVGQRHLPGPAVHRESVGHVPGAVRPGRGVRPVVRDHPARSAAGRGGPAGVSLRELAGTLYVSPRTHPDFWARSPSPSSSSPRP